MFYPAVLSKSNPHSAKLCTMFDMAALVENVKIRDGDLFSKAVQV